MTKDFEKLLNCCIGIINNIRKSWSDDFIGDIFKKQLLLAQESFVMQEIDFAKLTDIEMKLLGFRNFDNKNKNLIPLWIFQLLPDDTELYCPLDNSYELKKDADDDTRLGITAYMLVSRLSLDKLTNNKQGGIYGNRLKKIIKNAN